MLPIAAVGGISQALNRLAERNAADKISFPVILLMACALGPLGGILGLYVGAALVRVTGRWIGGTPAARRSAPPCVGFRSGRLGRGALDSTN